MNTGNDVPASRGSDPEAALTPEERALADRIVRSGPQGEPPSALDARILAAAHAALATPALAAGRTTPHARPRIRRRWPVALGAVATLVLAVGIAWQLRPVDDTRVEYSEAPRAARATPGPGGPQAADDQGQPTDSTPDRVAAPAPAPRELQAVVETEAPAPAANPAAERTAKDAAKPATAPEESPVVFDEPSPMDTPAPLPSPPPPAPAAPPTSVVEQAPVSQAMPAADAAASAAVESKTREQRARTRSNGDAANAAAAGAATASGNITIEQERAQRPNEADAADARALDRTEVGGARVDYFGDQPLDERPPASADSPQVQQAWLQRVRQLVAEHRIDAARDSLREYQRRYPKASLPADLRTLLVE